MTRVDRKVLEDAVRAHMRAEAEFDMESLRNSLCPDVDYHLLSPFCLDDPDVFGHMHGPDEYIAMWEQLNASFVYDIQIEHLSLDPETACATVFLQVTVVPKQDWHGIPAGQQMRWWTAARCVFDPNGLMREETVYGSFPPALVGYERMVAFAQAKQSTTGATR